MNDSINIFYPIFIESMNSLSYIWNSLSQDFYNKLTITHESCIITSTQGEYVLYELLEFESFRFK